MTRILAHRGPDNEGLFFDGALGIGHRRLSILDLSERGHQPMTTPDGRYTISYNGEIYNYLELRNELESQGDVVPYGNRYRSCSNSLFSGGRQTV